MAEKYSMKDDFFNSKKVHKIACEIKAVYEDFQQKNFEKQSVDKFVSLELKERIYHIRDIHIPLIYPHFKRVDCVIV